MEVCELCGGDTEFGFCEACCESLGEDRYIDELDKLTLELIRLKALCESRGTGESKPCPTCGKWSAHAGCPECIHNIFYKPYTLIECEDSEL